MSSGNGTNRKRSPWESAEEKQPSTRRKTEDCPDGVIDGGQPDKVSSVQDDIAAALPERESKADHAPATFCTAFSHAGNRKRASSQSAEAKKPANSLEN